MIRFNLFALIGIFAFITSAGFAQESSVISQTSYNAMELRNVSTGFASGRIADIAIHPEHENT